MNEKVDLRKTLDSYAARRGELREVDLPARNYLMFDGHGDPNTSPEFEAALRALYPIAYGLKFRSKRELGRDYVVPPLEGLWWAEDMAAFTSGRDKAQWDWTLMLLVPDWLGAADVEVARAGALAKAEKAEKAAGTGRRSASEAAAGTGAGDGTAAGDGISAGASAGDGAATSAGDGAGGRTAEAVGRLGEVRFASLEEGRCVQTLHVGSFDDEGSVIARMHASIAEQGLELAGIHHEIYLSDTRRTAPAKLRTILRQPVRAVG